MKTKTKPEKKNEPDEQETLAELIPRIEELHLKAEAAIHQAIKYARQVGELLIKAKDQIGHGEFTDWLEDNVSVTLPTARGYMRIARKWKIIVKQAGTEDISINQALQMLRFLRKLHTHWPTPQETGEAAHWHHQKYLKDSSIAKKMLQKELWREINRLGRYELFLLTREASGFLYTVVEFVIEQLSPIAQPIAESNRRIDEHEIELLREGLDFGDEFIRRHGGFKASERKQLRETLKELDDPTPLQASIIESVLADDGTRRQARIAADDPIPTDAGPIIPDDEEDEDEEEMPERGRIEWEQGDDDDDPDWSIEEAEMSAV